MSEDSKMKIALAQVFGLGAAIVSVALYSARIEAKAVDAQARTIELKAELSDIRKQLGEQRIILAEVQTDSKNILRSITDLKARKAGSK